MTTQFALTNLLKVQLGTFVGVIKCLDIEADQRMKSPHTNFTDAEST